MKRKNLLFLFLLLISLFLVGCKKKPNSNKEHTHTPSSEWITDEESHWHSCTKCDEILDKGAHHFVDYVHAKVCETCMRELNYTDEENFDYWVKGRDFSIDYDGIYTTSSNYTETNEVTGKIVEKNSCQESFSGSDYFLIREHQSNPLGIDSDNTSFEKSTTVVKKLLNAEREKALYYHMSESNDEIRKSASYVAPDYASRFHNYYNPSNLLEDYYIEDGKTFAELSENIKNGIAEGIEISVDIRLNKNSDGSVSLLIAFEMEEISDSIDDKDYQKTYSNFSYEIIVKDGKITSLIYKDATEEFYTDKAKNTFTTSYEKIDINYEFDKAKFESIDTTTDEIGNMYFAKILFVINGYEYNSVDLSYLVDSKYTLDNALYFFESDYTFMIGSRDTAIDSMMEFYIDKEMTIPLTEIEKLEPDTTIYIKLVVPTDYAMIISVIETESYSRINLIHLLPLNSEYIFDNYVPFYEVVLVDGETISDETSFICSENKVYVVIVTEKPFN